MSDPASRYYLTPSAELLLATGTGRPRAVRYLRRRFLPPLDRTVHLAEHRVSEGDRLDNLSARYLGDPLAFWSIADANLEPQPEALTEVGRRIWIAVPRP